MSQPNKIFPAPFLKLQGVGTQGNVKELCGAMDSSSPDGLLCLLQHVAFCYIECKVKQKTIISG